MYSSVPRFQNNATSIGHFKLDYCNSFILLHSLPNSQLNRLQQIQNSLACAVVKVSKFCHTTVDLKSLYWLKAMNAFNISSCLLHTKFSLLSLLRSKNVSKYGHLCSRKLFTDNRHRGANTIRKLGGTTQLSTCTDTVH